MKFKCYIVTYSILLLGVSACSYKTEERGKSVDIKRDATDFLLAKKSLRFIAQSKTDSLKLLLNEDILKNASREQFEILFTNGKTIIENNEYPNDSMVTVSYIYNKTLFSEKSYKEFYFPFVNLRQPDSTMVFDIAISNGKIDKLFISTGVTMKKIL